MGICGWVFGLGLLRCLRLGGRDVERFVDMYITYRSGMTENIYHSDSGSANEAAGVYDHIAKL